MTATTSPETAVRTYGGWRHTRGIGLFGLGATATAVVLTCLVLPLLALGTSVRAGLLTAAPCARGCSPRHRAPSWLG